MDFHTLPYHIPIRKSFIKLLITSAGDIRDHTDDSLFSSPSGSHIGFQILQCDSDDYGTSGSRFLKRTIFEHLKSGLISASMISNKCIRYRFFFSNSSKHSLYACHIFANNYVIDFLST